MEWGGRMTAARWAVLAVLAAGAMAGEARAEDKKKGGVDLKTEDGLHFQLPPDWPVEKRGGLVAPIPIEEYITKKFTALESRLQNLEQQVSALDLRLRVAEERSKKEQLKSSEGAP